jgi:hypothetical protein
MTETDPLTLALSELHPATKALGAGDEEVTRLAVDFGAMVASVTTATARASGDAARLHSDDVSNPAGVARQLAELPASLKATTEAHLAGADVQLDVIEGIHLERLLRHNPKSDQALIAELANWTANLKQENAVATMVQLAANPRYSTILAGPLGDSLGARFNFDSAILRKVALESLAVNGTEDQVRRSQALAAIPAARRVIGLAKAGRDNVAEQSQRAPRRQQTVSALMP